MKTNITPILIAAPCALFTLLLACCKESPTSQSSKPTAAAESPKPADETDVLDIICLTADGEEKAGGDPKDFWKNKNTFLVRFLDGETKLHDRVIAEAAEWTKHANVRFVKTAAEPSDIRVTFQGGGNWSLLGKQALQAAANAPTLSLRATSGLFGGNVPRRKILHEFGHALGLRHEHQHPSTPIIWNEEVVIAAFAAPPNKWDAQKTHLNVLDKYSGPWTGTAEPDPDSIMIYAIPASWTKNGISYSENEKLSAKDISVIRLHYGHPQ